MQRKPIRPKSNGKTGRSEAVNHMGRELIAANNGGKIVRYERGSGPGRKPGVPNKTTVILKDAILLAAAEAGEDLKGKGGLQGYLLRVAKKDMKSFCALLRCVLPLHIKASLDADHNVTFRTASDIRNELHRRGVPIDGVFKVIEPLAEPDDDDDVQEAAE